MQPLQPTYMDDSSADHGRWPSLGWSELNDESYFGTWKDIPVPHATWAPSAKSEPSTWEVGK